MTHFDIASIITITLVLCFFSYYVGWFTRDEAYKRMRKHHDRILNQVQDWYPIVCSATQWYHDVVKYGPGTYNHMPTMRKYMSEKQCLERQRRALEAARRGERGVTAHG